MIAGKVAAAVDLQHHLAQRDNAGHLAPASSDAGGERRAVHDGRSLDRRWEYAPHRSIEGYRQPSRHLVQRDVTKVGQFRGNVLCGTIGVLHSANHIRG